MILQFAYLVAENKDTLIDTAKWEPKGWEYSMSYRGENRKMKSSSFIQLCTKLRDWTNKVWAPAIGSCTPESGEGRSTAPHKEPPGQNHNKNPRKQGKIFWKLTGHYDVLGISPMNGIILTVALLSCICNKCICNKWKTSKVEVGMFRQVQQEWWVLERQMLIIH